MPDTTFLKFRRFCFDEKLIDRNDKLIIALSGGSDSVLLLHFLLKLQKELNLQLLALHVNHGLREEESKKDEEFCRITCQQLQVELVTLAIDVRSRMKENDISLEMAARDIRYQEFELIRIERGFSKIVTGHNIDDNAETVLLNLIKGKGPEATAGIPVKRGFIIRPLLELSKAEIEGWLCDHHIEWVTDSSNSDTVFQRNFIRHRIMPLFRDLNPSFPRSIFNYSGMMRTLLGAVPKDFKITRTDESGNILINPELAFTLGEHQFHREISIRLIENFNLNLKFKNFKNLNNLLRSQSGRKINLGEGVIAFRDRREIVVGHEHTNKINEMRLVPGISIVYGEFTISCGEVPLDHFSKNAGKEIAFIDAGKIESGLSVRGAGQGDTFKPLGGSGKKKISDFYNDIKLESRTKWLHPVVYDSEKIVWVCGFRPDERYKITAETKKIYKLEIEKWIELQ